MLNVEYRTSNQFLIAKMCARQNLRLFGRISGLIRVFAVRMKSSWVIRYTMGSQWRLIFLGLLSAWPKSSQDGHFGGCVRHIKSHLNIHEHNAEHSNPMSITILTENPIGNKKYVIYIDLGSSCKYEDQACCKCSKISNTSCLPKRGQRSSLIKPVVNFLKFRTPVACQNGA